MATIKMAAVIFIGLASGLSVGLGFVAFLSVFGIIPRLTQLSKTMSKIPLYEWAVIFGAVSGVAASLRNPILGLAPYWLVPFGLAGGIFVGMVAAALTEVINVLPILAKRIGVEGKIVSLLMAIVLGKIFGSLFQWVYFIHQ